MNYNRPSGGYQKNLYRQKLNAEGIKTPKSVDPKKLKWFTIGVGVVWLVVTILLISQLKWMGLLIGVLIGAALVGGLYLFLQYKQREVIRYYKQIGLTEDMYISELKKRGTEPKQLEAYRKVWRKTKLKEKK